MSHDRTGFLRFKDLVARQKGLRKAWECARDEESVPSLDDPLFLAKFLSAEMAAHDVLPVVERLMRCAEVVISDPTLSLDDLSEALSVLRGNTRLSVEAEIYVRKHWKHGMES